MLSQVVEMRKGEQREKEVYGQAVIGSAANVMSADQNANLILSKYKCFWKIPSINLYDLNE